MMGGVVYASSTSFATPNFLGGYGARGCVVTADPRTRIVLSFECVCTSSTRRTRRAMLPDDEMKTGGAL